MTMRISQRDLEAISAYLDEQLTQRERARLEARLQKDAGLREAYEQLHHTRAVLRSLPVVRAPRNFTLTPQMVKSRKSPPPAYPVLRLASVMATLLFVLVMVGDLLTPRGVALAPVLDPSAGEEATIMQAPAETEAPFLEAAPAAEPEEEAPKSLAEDQVEGEAAPAPGIMEFASPTPSLTEAARLEPPAVGAELTAEAGAPEAELQEMDGAREAEPQELDTARAVPPSWNIWRILQVVFALVALATGLAAAFLRRGMAG